MQKPSKVPPEGPQSREEGASNPPLVESVGDDDDDDVDDDDFGDGDDDDNDDGFDDDECCTATSGIKNKIPSFALILFITQCAGSQSVCELMSKSP